MKSTLHIWGQKYLVYLNLKTVTFDQLAVPIIYMLI